MVDELLRRYKPVSEQIEVAELRVILSELEAVIRAQTYGAVVELGCFVGTTSLFIRRVLDELDATRDFHVYDSFAGLPAKSSQDTSPVGQQFETSQLAASKNQLTANFKKARLAIPVIHKSWFGDITEDDMPSALAFAFLDGDFYGSIKTSLELVGPRLSIGGKVVVDDYQSEALPGVKTAVDEWLERHQMRLRVEASLAILG
jgi:O-methyltransferase